MPDTTLDIAGSHDVTTPAPPTVYAAGASNGVSYTPPPTEAMPAITASIQQALSTLEPGQTGGLIALYSRNADGTQNANAVIVQKVLDGKVDLDAMTWVGKTWRPNADGSGWNYGAAVKVGW